MRMSVWSWSSLKDFLWGYECPYRLGQSRLYCHLLWPWWMSSVFSTFCSCRRLRWCSHVFWAEDLLLMLVPGTLHQPSSEIFALIDQVICKGLNGFMIEIGWAVDSVHILKSGWCRLCYHHYEEIKTFKEGHIEWFLIHDDMFQNLHTDMCQGLCSGHCLWAGDRDQMASYFTKAPKKNYPKILQNVDERRDLIEDLQLYDSIHDSKIWPSKELQLS